MARNLFWMTLCRRHLGFFAGAPPRPSVAGGRLPVWLQAAPRVERLEDRLAPAPLADVAVTKTGPAIVTAGLQATYTITVTNSGPDDAQNVALTDTLPAAEAFVSASEGTGSGTSYTDSIGTLAVNAVRTVTLVAKVSPSAPNGMLTNTATVFSTTADSNAANNTTTFDTEVSASADLAVTKTGPFTASLYLNSQAGDYVGGGQTVTFTRATGSFNAQANSDDSVVAFSYQDSNPSVWWSLTFAGPNHATLTPGNYGNAARYPFQASTQPGLSVYGDYRGSNTLTGNFTVRQAVYDAAGNVLNFDATFEQHSEGATPALFGEIKYDSGQVSTTATAGTTVTYTLTATNNGPSDAQSVTLTDTLPAGETFVSASQGAGSGTSYTDSIGTLAASVTRTVTLVARIDPGTPNGNTLTDTTNVASTTPDSNAANDNAIFDTTVTTSADLAIAKTGPATAVPGSRVTYTLALTNNGPSDAQSVTVTDTLPAGETFVSASEGGGAGTSFNDPIGTFGAGTARTVVLVASINATTPGGMLSDTANVSSTTTDSNTANNTATFETAVIAADLAVTKTGPFAASLYLNSQAGDFIGQGRTVTFTAATGSFSVQRNFDKGVSFTYQDANQPESWSLDFASPLKTTLTRGSYGNAARFPFQAGTQPGLDVSGDGRGSNTLTGNFTVLRADYDAAGNVLNFDATFEQHSEGATPALFGEIKYDSGQVSTTATAGTTLTYTLTATNNGPSDAQNAALTDTLPAGETFVSASEGTGSGTSYNDSIGTLAAGTTRTVRVVATISPSAVDGSTLTDSASVTSTTPDSSAGNNTAVFDTTVTTSADLSIIKTSPVTSVPMGTPITYTLTVANAGPSDAQAVFVTDTPPAGTTIDFMTFPQGFRGTNLAYNLGTVPAGATITGTVVIRPALPGPATDTVSVGSGTSDPSATNNASTATTTVMVAPFSGRVVPVNGFELSALNNAALATFTHANGVEPATAFTATVAWGDGTSSSGQVRQESDGSYTVTGSHTYGDERAYSIAVTVSDPFSSATLTATATILEELLPDGTRGTANQRFISEVYRDLLGRQVDASGLATWAAALNAGFSRLQVVTTIESSKEFRTVEVQAVYQQYLHRAVDPVGSESSLSFLNSGGTVEQLAAILASSPEYNAHTDGTNDGWLEAVYQDALHRPVDANGRVSADHAFAVGASHATIASAILASDEHHLDLVQSYYLRFLDRPTTGDAGAQAWFQQLKAGSRDEALIAGIMAHAGMEFYNKIAP